LGKKKIKKNLELKIGGIFKREGFKQIKRI
jgi:hypothetical protein